MRAWSSCTRAEGLRGYTLGCRTQGGSFRAAPSCPPTPPAHPPPYTHFQSQVCRKVHSQTRVSDIIGLYPGSPKAKGPSARASGQGKQGASLLRVSEPSCYITFTESPGPPVSFALVHVHPSAPKWGQTSLTLPPPPPRSMRACAWADGKVTPCHSALTQPCHPRMLSPLVLSNPSPYPGC